jgi:hypothetical protein
VADLILHHYRASPFAEGIRTILGYKGLRRAAVERRDERAGTVGVHFPRMGFAGRKAT